MTKTAGAHPRRRQGERRTSDRLADDTAMTVVPRILVAIADDEVRRTMSATLRHEGFCVSAPDTAASALEQADSFCPDVVIVDAGLGIALQDGGEHPAVEAFRTSTEQYVLCIAGENEHDVRAAALHNGADDAISHPIHAVELTARCQALLRRPRRLRSTIELVDHRTLQFGPIEVDPSRHELRVGGEHVAATRIEFALLEQLCRRPLEVATRGELLDAVWGPSWGGDHHIVDVHLSNLRRKVDRYTDLKVIHTVRGVGFRLADEITEHLRSGDADGTESGDLQLSVA